MRKSLCVAVVQLRAAIAHAQSTTSAILGQVRAETEAALSGVEITAGIFESGLVRTGRHRRHGALHARRAAGRHLRSARDARSVPPARAAGDPPRGGRAGGAQPDPRPGGADDEITVTAEAPLVQTRSGEISYLVSEQAIRDLPLNGRNYTDLAFLQPGVISYPHRDTGSVVAHGVGMSVNGQDPRSNAYMLDGTLLNDFTNGPAGSAAGTSLGTETIREFRVEANAYGAEFGRNSGGHSTPSASPAATSSMARPTSTSAMTRSTPPTTSTCPARSRTSTATSSAPRSAARSARTRRSSSSATRPCARSWGARSRPPCPTRTPARASCRMVAAACASSASTPTWRHIWPPTRYRTAPARAVGWRRTRSCSTRSWCRTTSRPGWTRTSATTTS